MGEKKRRPKETDEIRITGDAASVAGGTFVGGEKTTRPPGSRTIHTGGGAYIEGAVSTGGGDFVGRDKITYDGGQNTDTIAKAFADLYEAIGQMPEGPDKAIATQAAEGLEQEAKKGDRAEESAVRRWLNFLAEAAPDAWQVAVDTFTNPIKGLSTAFQKIAQKAQESKEAKEGS